MAQEFWGGIDAKYVLGAIGVAAGVLVPVVAPIISAWKKGTIDLSQTQQKALEAERARLDAIDQQQYARLETDLKRKSDECDRYRTNLFEEERKHQVTKIDRDAGWNKLRWCYEQWRKLIHEVRRRDQVASLARERLEMSIGAPDQNDRVKRILDTWAIGEPIPDAPAIENSPERLPDDFRYGT